MSGQKYGGQPGNIATIAAVNIASSTATNPIQITTSTPHGLTTGDWVDVYGHTVNLPANCLNTQITLVSSTQFTVPINGTGSTAGGATGVVAPLAYTQNIATIPADGDPHDASTYVPGYTALLDRSAYERANSGSSKLVYYNVGKVSASFGTTWYTNTTNSVTFQAGVFTTGAGTFPSSGLVTSVGVNDIVDISFDGTFSVNTAVGLIIQLVGSWGNQPLSTKLPGSAKQFVSQGASSVWPVRLQAQFTGDFGVTSPVTVSQLTNIGFSYQMSAATSTTTSGIGDFTASIQVWRPTTIAQ